MAFITRKTPTLMHNGRGVDPSDPYRGNVDGYNGRDIYGWVARSSDGTGGLIVGLFVADELLATTLANVFRADVRDAGVGDGTSGFNLEVTREISAAAQRSGGQVTIRVMDAPSHQVGKLVLPAPGESTLNTNNPQLQQCRKLLFGDLETMRKLSIQLDKTRNINDRPALAVHELLFSTENLVPGEEPSSGQQLPAYLDYIRHRLRQDVNFDPNGSEEEYEHFIDFYLKAYGTQPGHVRAPLSKAVIEHLNAPILVGGQQLSLTRYIWWRLLACPPMLQHLKLNSVDHFNVIAFWWAWHEAKALQVEDCLVPQRIIEHLRSVPPNRRADEMPVTLFMDRIYHNDASYQFLNLGSVEGRLLLTLSLMVAAVNRPDILRYLHPPTVKMLLAREGKQPSAFARFVSLLLPTAALPEMTRARFAGILRLQGYDLDRNIFLSLAPSGHRLAAAALPPVTGREVDVQLIGPFRKASGLGMATRLSGLILEQTSLKVNCVDFGLDNPAPEGFSKVNTLDDFKPAKINIIHLNAESVPLLYAYGPDVLSGSYNIGYFYWELDTPALCHYLGMGLLDEIWVSADYGVQIYKREAGKPVTNVGMCYEDLPPIDKAEARRQLDERLNLIGGEFIVFVAFDSFSFAQRKNPLATIAAFQRAFPDVPNARLIVKTQNRDFVVDPVQQHMWRRIDSLVDKDPRILIINETLVYDDLLRLKAAADCYLSLHRSEGWGFGMIEAMNLRVPVVCTGYSANLEFCTNETSWLVDYEEITLAREDYIFVRKGQKWADPDIGHAARQLRSVYDDPVSRKSRVEAAFRNVQENFSAKAISLRYEARLQAILREVDAKRRPEEISKNK